ncbi:MAG: hypothetical protein NT049_02260 [Planctomycetota bacterium]|nr:hypothetical protein [Planctomycetota bacterium]
MKRDDEDFRMSDSGLEPVAVERRSGNSRSSGPGSAGKKKVILLVVLAVAAVGFAAYQFLGGASPKEAAAVTTMGGVAAATDLSDVETALKGFDGAESGGAKDMTVARVEELVKKFDGYVAERQVPLKDLRSNPFMVAVEPKAEKVEAADSSAAPLAQTAAPDPAVEARAKTQRIRESASRLVLGSVLVAGNSRLAMINGSFCRVGDAVEGFRVAAIEADRVRVSSEGETVDVCLPMATKSSSKGSSNGR